MSAQLDAARLELWNRTVFDAICVLRAAMRDPDTPEARAAAVEVIRLETCRMRHGTLISGTQDAFAEFDDTPPVAAPARPAAVQKAEPDLRTRWAERGFAGLYDLLPLPPDMIPAEYPGWGLTPDGLPGPELLARLGLSVDAPDDQPDECEETAEMPAAIGPAIVGVNPPGPFAAPAPQPHAKPGRCHAPAAGKNGCTPQNRHASRGDRATRREPVCERAAGRFRFDFAARRLYDNTRPTPAGRAAASVRCDAAELPP